VILFSMFGSKFQQFFFGLGANFLGAVHSQITTTQDLCNDKLLSPARLWAALYHWTPCTVSRFFFAGLYHLCRAHDREVMPYVQDDSGRASREEVRGQKKGFEVTGAGYWGAGNGREQGPDLSGWPLLGLHGPLLPSANLLTPYSCILALLFCPAFLPLTRGASRDRLGWLTYGERRHRTRERGSKIGPAVAENRQKIQKRC